MWQSTGTALQHSQNSITIYDDDTKYCNGGINIKIPNWGSKCIFCPLIIKVKGAESLFYSFEETQQQGIMPMTLIKTLTQLPCLSLNRNICLLSNHLTTLRKNWLASVHYKMSLFKAFFFFWYWILGALYHQAKSLPLFLFWDMASLNC